MAITPFDKWPELSIKPLDFGQLMQAQAQINKANQDKTDRDLKMYEQVGSLKGTHIPTIPGTVDEAKQRAAEEEGFAKLNDLSDQYAKGKINYKQMMMGYYDIHNSINGPAAQKRKENFENFQKTKKQEVELKTANKWSPLLHGDTVTANADFDSDKGDQWDKTLTAYSGREILETPFNNMTPTPKGGGVISIDERDIKARTEQILPQMMGEPDVQQQIQILKRSGDTRPDQDIARDLLNQAGMEYYKLGYAKTAGKSKSSGKGKGKDDEETILPTPTRYDFPHFEMGKTYESTDKFREERAANKENINQLSAALVEANSPDVEANSALMQQAFKDPKVKYIKMADGHIYDKNDISSQNPNAQIMDAVYQQEIGNKLQGALDLDQVHREDNEQIIRNAMEKNYGPGHYQAYRNKVLDEDGNYSFATTPKVFEDADFKSYKSTMVNTLRADGRNQQAAELEAITDNAKALAKMEDLAGQIQSPVTDALIHKTKTELQNADPGYKKWQKAYDKAFDEYYNPKIDVIPQGHLFEGKDKIKTDLPNLVNHFNVYDGNNNLVRGGNKSEGPLPSGKVNVVGWAMLPDKGIVIEVNVENDKTKQKSDPYFVDISGSYEKDFYMSRGLAGERSDMIKAQLDRKFTSPTAAQSSKVSVDGKDYNIVTRNGNKYIGYTDDSTGKYEMIPVQAENNTLLAKQLESISGSQTAFNTDEFIYGLIGSEGGKNINNLSGSGAQGYFQIIPKYHKDVFAQLGYNVDAPGFDVKDLPYNEQVQAVKLIQQKNAPEAYNLFTSYGHEPNMPLKSRRDFDWGAYFLGTAGLEKWLKTFKSNGLEAANQTIPGYSDNTNMGLDEYIERNSKKAMEFNDRKNPYNSRSGK